MMLKEHVLDNPVWNSLNQVHKGFSITHQAVKFYNPAYCLFGGSVDVAKSINGISEYSSMVDDFFVVGEKPLLDSSVAIKRDLVCNQMVLEERIDMELREQIIHLKDENKKRELFDLVSLVQPGYFKNKTVDLEKYFGIYKAHKLISVTGERMKMNEFTEISAIVTHPEHTRWLC
ncbi:MAG: hypothetical protein ACI9LN_003065 [Saprospiraceae bacterium]|jgi:hypothetical protein